MIQKINWLNCHWLFFLRLTNHLIKELFQPKLISHWCGYSMFPLQFQASVFLTTLGFYFFNCIPSNSACLATKQTILHHAVSPVTDSLLIIAVPQSLSHQSLLFNFNSSISASERNFLFLVADRHQGKPTSLSWNSPEPLSCHRTGPSNQSTANTAAELFTGSGQQVFCIWLL